MSHLLIQNFEIRCKARMMCEQLCKSTKACAYLLIVYINSTHSNSTYLYLDAF